MIQIEQDAAREIIQALSHQYQIYLRDKYQGCGADLSDEMAEKVLANMNMLCCGMGEPEFDPSEIIAFYKGEISLPTWSEW